MTDLSARLYPGLIKRTLAQLADAFKGSGASDFAHDVQIAVNSLRDGRMNVTGSFTPDATDTETTIADPLITTRNVVLIVPYNDDAVTLGTPTIKEDTQATGTVTVEHSAAAGTEVYRYVVLG